MDLSDITINNSFEVCPDQRFTNPTRLTLWSYSSVNEYEAISGGCDDRIGSEDRPNKINNNLTASPIPSTDVVNIEGLCVGEELFLYDVLGNVLQKKMSDGSVTQINLGNVPCGVYYLHQKNNKSIKIIKID